MNTTDRVVPPDSSGPQQDSAAEPKPGSGDPTRPKEGDPITSALRAMKIGSAGPRSSGRGRR